MLTNENLQGESQDLLQRYLKYLQEKESLIKSLGSDSNIRIKNRQARLAQIETRLIPELHQEIIGRKKCKKK